MSVLFTHGFKNDPKYDGKIYKINSRKELINLLKKTTPNHVGNFTKLEILESKFIKENKKFNYEVILDDWRIGYTNGLFNENADLFFRSHLMPNIRH